MYTIACAFEGYLWQWIQMCFTERLRAVVYPNILIGVIKITDASYREPFVKKLYWTDLAQKTAKSTRFS